MLGLTMSDLDPTEANSLEELAECLKQLHIRADRPAYRELEQRTIHENGLLPGTRLKRTRLGRTTLSDVLLGRKFPGKAFMLTFVDTCGIDLEKDPRWEQAWDQLAGRYLAQGAIAEAEGLRQQLAAALAAKTEADQARQAAEQATDEARQAAQAEVERVQAELAEREAELSTELERADTEAAAAIEAAQRSARAQVAEAQQAAAEQVQAALADRDRAVAAANERTRIAEAQQEVTRARPTPSDAARLYPTGIWVSMPQMGESITEGTVMRWLKKDGDRIEEDEPLLEISTDKVDTEVPCPASGIVRAIAVEEGETVAVGVLLAVIEPDQDS